MGTPPRADPWVEQARRHAAHEERERADRRRTRKRLGIVVVCFAALAAVGVAALLVVGGAVPDGAIDLQSTAPNPPPVVPPDDLVIVDDVWLVDRGDVIDWGVTVLAAPLAPTRSEVQIEVRLVDADGVVVETFRRLVDGVDEDSPGVAIGQLIDSTVAPVRIEFDIGVGVASNDDALDELLEIGSLRRTGDELSGVIRSSAVRPVRDVTAVFVWRDADTDDVVATALRPIEVVPVDADATFAFDLGDLGVPEGRPGEVFWIETN